ncbi:MAG: peptidase S8, partial [Gammaproteobacteria bacterium]|nr:peptidase S8 [Gammaproteobacteria bacterium]
NLSAAKYEWVHHQITVPQGASNFTVQISGGSGDADLYTRFDAAPTTSSYDCRPYKNGNNETCSDSSPSAGTWYIGLRAYAAFSGVSLTAEFD